jgi:hypothetical protein
MIVALGAAPAAATEGCTPGYWKQPQHFDSWPAGYDPDQDFDTVFTNIYLPAQVVNLFNPNITLLEALQLQGSKDGVNQLARTAVATLLNWEKFGDRFTEGIPLIKYVVYNTQFWPKSTIMYWQGHFDAANNAAVCTLN